MKTKKVDRGGSMPTSLPEALRRSRLALGEINACLLGIGPDHGLVTDPAEQELVAALYAMGDLLKQAGADLTRLERLLDRLESRT